jgi:hypothetical protein
MSKQISFPPLSGRQVAAYLGVSPSQFCMSNSNSYMNRQLGPGQSLKITELMQAHMLAQSGSSPSIKKLQKQDGNDCACLADKMKLDARYHSLRIPGLQQRLNDMKTKVERDTAWLNTLDRLIAKLPPETKPKSPERIWLENQDVLVLERLKKNGPLAQMKLEVQIAMEQAKARVYHEAYAKHAKK